MTDSADGSGFMSCIPPTGEFMPATHAADMAVRTARASATTAGRPE